MTKQKVKVTTPVYDSFRVKQIGGMFDVPYQERLSSEFSFDVPDMDSDWKIGLVVGPSGSGKTTIIKTLFGQNIYQGFNWDESKAIVDNFGDYPIKQIVSILTSVGFGSPPSWIKPYQVLSNGEKFRCDLAKALLDSENNPVVFDEYTSVVDRTVAKVCSLAIYNAIHKGIINKKFIAVTCHYDVAEWLQPDWVLDMATGDVARRCLQRPKINLKVRQCSKDVWRYFGRHHYLTSDLNSAATCYLASWDETPVAFIAVLSAWRQHRRRVSRIVVLPDYQGIGIGGRFIDAIGEIYKKKGYKLSAGGSHPSFLNHCRNSPKWKCGYYSKTGGVYSKGKSVTTSLGRIVVGFSYTG